MVADAYPVSPGNIDPLRFVAGSHEGRLCRPDNLSESPSRVRGGRGEGLPSHH
jgi:hypothetical protein